MAHLAGQLARAIGVFALALLLTLFVGTTVRVDGDSMLPTLHDGERAWVPRYEAWWPPSKRGAVRGDIVFFRPPGAAPSTALDRLLGGPFVVKRVVGLAGERLAIHGGVLSIDELVIEEPYVSGPSERGVDSTLVPPGALYVLGDHRAPLASRDSRSFGAIDEGSVAGRLSAVVWPPLRRDHHGSWRWNLRWL